MPSFIIHSFTKYSLRPISISSQLSARWGEPSGGAAGPRFELGSAVQQACALPTESHCTQHFGCKIFSISQWNTEESVFILCTRSTSLQHILLFLHVSCMLIAKKLSFLLILSWVFSHQKIHTGIWMYGKPRGVSVWDNILIPIIGCRPLVGFQKPRLATISEPVLQGVPEGSALSRRGKNILRTQGELADIYSSTVNGETA
jgi:hypothetical protein